MLNARVAVMLGCFMFALVACGGGEPPAAPPPPALVVHPGAGADAFGAYAGEVRAREESPLSFRVPGKLIRREVDTGIRVRAGQVLAVLDPGDLRLQAQAAQAKLAAAEAELARARDERDRYSRLVKQQMVSQSAYDGQLAAYKAAEAQVRAVRAESAVALNQAGYAQLRAPSDGVIASRQAEAGQTVSAGQPIYTLAADGGREVLISLPENRYRDVQLGQPVLVELWSAPGQRLQGHVREIAPAADPQTRTYATRIALEAAAASQVELGQSARVYVASTDSRQALVLPLGAVQRGADGRSAVWVVDPASGKVSSRPVVLGAYGQQDVPVLAGVAATDWVVAAGGHLLREGMQVAPVDRNNRPIAPARTAEPQPKAE